MELLKNLEEAGLTGNESRVYLELLKKGELSANQIAKNIGMDRTLTYTVLNHLIEKGQVNYIIKINKKIFSCSAPENLINNLKEKEAIITDLIEEIKKIEKQERIESEVRVYEGKEGVRTFIKHALKSKEFWAFGGTGRIYDIIYEIPAIVKKLEKTKTKIKVIINPTYKKHEFAKHKNIEIKCLDINGEATTTIFGNNVSIHLVKDKPIIIIIKNKDIANTYKSLFNELWKIAKP